MQVIRNDFMKYRGLPCDKSPDMCWDALTQKIFETFYGRIDRNVPFNLRQSGPTPVEMLIDTRVRKSPYWHLSMEAGCWRASVYNHRYHPRGFIRFEDGGPMAEYDALVNHVTLWDVAVERQIQVKGPDAEAFVN